MHLLARAAWEADAVRDDLRDYVIDTLHETSDRIAELLAQLGERTENSTKLPSVRRPRRFCSP